MLNLRHTGCTGGTGCTGMNVMASVYDTLMRWDPESKAREPQLAVSLERTTAASPGP